MFCISLANLRKWVKIPYNLLGVNDNSRAERNAEIVRESLLFIDRRTPLNKP